MEPGKEYIEVVYSHEPFKIHGRPTDDIVRAVLADYLEHFPGYKGFIEAIAAARFSSNARKAYSWLHATSSWGKTFLMNGVLGSDELNLVCGMTVQEIEKIFSGSPVGKSQNDFVSSWVLFVDEVRYLSGDIKQLDREITGSPKHQLSFRAKVHSKVFCSAFAMDSLAGDTGVESQFVSRFSYIRPALNVRIEDRELFRELSATVYRKALAAWTADYLNRFVHEQRTLGASVAESRILSAAHCDKILDAYHDEHNIGKVLGSLDDRLAEYADEVRDLMRQVSAGNTGALIGRSKQMQEAWSGSCLTRCEHPKYGTVVVVKTPITLIKAWATDKFSKSAGRGQVLASSSQILALVDVQGRESRTVHIPQDDGSQWSPYGIIVAV